MCKDMCVKCLGKAEFQEFGTSDDGRKCRVLFCPDCKNYTRDFLAPQTELEVVEDALRTEALSDEEIRALLPPIEVPAREQEVERQLRMFTDQPRVHY